MDTFLEKYNLPKLKEEEAEDGIRDSRISLVGSEMCIRDRFLIVFIWILSLFFDEPAYRLLDFIYLFKEPAPRFIDP